MNDPAPSGTVVIGVGNPLMGDDGLGLAVLAVLQTEWRFDPPVTLLDGGTWGMNLLPQMEDATRLLLLDAIKAGRAPGTPVELVDDAIPRLFATKLSPHEIDLREVLALAELRGTLPAHVVALGAEPERVELGTELRPVVAAAVPHLVERAVAQLVRWGHRATRTSRRP